MITYFTVETDGEAAAEGAEGIENILRQNEGLRRGYE